jgi:hypothetical protein
MPPTSNNSQDPASPSTPPQSIPLRDLTRPPDSADLGDGHGRHTRGRSLLSGGSRPATGHNFGPRYERLGDTSPSPIERAAYRASPLELRPVAPYEEPQTPTSPVGNPADFQAAMGFAGLLVPDISVSHAPRERSNSYDTGSFDHISPYHDGSIDDNPTYNASESDAAPLTNPMQLQPISGAQSFEAQGQRHDRASFRNVSFSSPGPEHRTSRLGDDLENIEAGRRHSRNHSYGVSLAPEDSRARSRSPSTATAFSRAGSIVRAMSQRVVNLSGEAEFIEESARRQARHATRQNSRATPRRSEQTEEDEFGFSDISSLSEESEPVIRRKADPLGAGPNYQANLPTAPVEKAMRFFGGAQPEPSWEQEPTKPPNPLRGKSLGIFSPESRVRNWLCDLLVYPLTEPFILLLIVVQTIILAVDASKNVNDPGNERPQGWDHSGFNYALLVLFVIFTFEIVARIIVSGFIFNAPEYGNGKRGVRKALADKYRAVFAPQRQSSLKAPRRTGTSFSTPEILRSFTAKQGEGIRTVEQAQRLQLARRAFLRHGFNRLDFVAVVSFWISFVLGVTMIESAYHVYVFRMLSCLRIIRLLALTHGTAVCIPSSLDFATNFGADNLTKSEKSRTIACQRIFFDRLLLATFCHHWRSELQVQLRSSMCLARSNGSL